VKTFPVVFTGHVDHGKSTLVSRLLLDTGYFPDGKFAELEAAAARRGVPLEISFLLDSFQVERDQAVTIDATRIWFNSATRRYAIIDAPGHREFVRHMVSGAADALAAVVVVDAVEGVGEQTRRHALLLPLVGVTRAVVAINKMDAVGFDSARYGKIADDVHAVFSQTGLELVAAIPTVARDGDNVAQRSQRMDWYTGPALLEALESLDERAAVRAPLRFPVHDVYRRDDERILVGNLDGGRVSAGMTLFFSPTRDRARVSRIVRFPESGQPAEAGEAFGFTLDHPIFVGPGDIASEPGEAPHVAESIDATIFWLERAPLEVGENVRMRCGTRDVTVVLDAIRGVIDIETFAEGAATLLQRNDIARVTLRGLQPLVVDTHPAKLARFALYRGDAVGGGGIVRTVVTERGANRRSSPEVESRAPGVRAADRVRRNNHRGLVVWLTGLPGAGKSTLAAHVEAALFADGWSTYVLDGDTLRGGLNGDLGFLPPDRLESARRAGEVAALFADAGSIALVAQVSPLVEGRALARAAAPQAFLEIYVRADLATCEARDTKGQYRRARDGALENFTGISAPYEEPPSPDLIVDTAHTDIETCTRDLLSLVRAAARG
jgi:bifunctional enzyme CysN/CysC